MILELPHDNTTVPKTKNRKFLNRRNVQPLNAFEQNKASTNTTGQSVRNGVLSVKWVVRGKYRSTCELWDTKNNIANVGEE